MTKKTHGFTIIEVMIAAAVFSMVLVLVTTAIIQISRLYYKGVTLSNTQNTARSVIDVISQAIQFSGEDIVPTISGTASPTAPKAFCIGGQRFTYDLGWQVNDSPNASKHQAYHALVQDTYPGCTSLTTQPLNVAGAAGKELLAPNMRLANISVTPVSANQYRIDIKVVYGDDDLLNGGPDNDPTTQPETVVCKTQRSGTQFCGVSQFSTVVTKRVQ